MAGDIKLKYAASVAPTVTNLQSLASSQSWVGGWTQGSVSNASNVYLDYLYSGTFTTHASNRQAGTINVWCVAALNDTPTWPAISSGTLGTEGAAAFADIYRRDSLLSGRLLASIYTDNTASAIYTFPPTGIAQLFGGSLPVAHTLFVSVNTTTTTTAGLASSGNAIYYTPTYNAYT